MAKHNVDIHIRAKDHASNVFKQVAIAAGAFLSVRAIGRFAKESTSLFIEQEKSTIKLAAALRATSNAAGFTQKQLSKYANELQDSTTIGNEAFESAMSVMATFRNVSGKTFKESILLAADMSQALGTDLQGSVRLLGKALNDPIRGITALSNVGITFSEVQKKQIKLFQDTNGVAATQKIILNKLTNLYGGQAKAQADSFGGSIIQMKNAFGELRKSMGKAIAEMPGFQTGIKVTTVLFQNLGDTVNIMWLQMKLSAIGFWEDFKHIFGAQIPELFKWFIQNWKDAFTTIWNGTKSIITNMAKNIWDFFKDVTGWLKGEGFNFKWTGLLDGFESTLKELPDLAGRAMTEIENELAAKLLLVQVRLGKKIGEKLAIEYAVGRRPGDIELPELPDVGAAAAAARKREGFGELVRFAAGVPTGIRGGFLPGRRRGTIEEQALQEQKKAARKRADLQGIQENIERLLTKINQNISPVAVTAFH